MSVTCDKSVVFSGSSAFLQSTNKTYLHDRTEILLKVASYTTKQTRQINLFYNESLLIPLLHTLFPIPSSLNTIPPCTILQSLFTPYTQNNSHQSPFIITQYTLNRSCWTLKLLFTMCTTTQEKEKVKNVTETLNLI